ncbi:MAG: hypothetical protein HY043_21480 [Verrucomicrobia bacterium]|nr:hypothetical protein [Verrucomicrobiota bacterium]
MKTNICLCFGFLVLASTAFAAPPFYPVATTNTLVPGGFANFTRFWTAGINNSTVAFVADGLGPRTVFVQEPGQQLTNPVVETVIEFGLYNGNLGNLLYTVHNPNNEDNDVIFDQTGIGTTVAIVARTNAVPFGSGTFDLKVGPAAEDAGVVAFAGLGSNDAGVYLANLAGNRVTVIATRNTGLPSANSGCGTNLYEPTHIAYAGGVLAFVARLGGPLCNNIIGLYSTTGSGFTNVADINTLAPPFSTRITSLGPIQIAGNQVVFKARTGGTPAPGGIYIKPLDGSGSPVALITSEAFFPGTTNKLGSEFGNFTYENGVLAFEITGGSYTNTGIYVLTNGVITRVIGNGDLLDGKTVSALLLGQQSLSRGILVFTVYFTDDSTAVYTASGAPFLGAGGLLQPGSMVYSAATGFSFTFEGQPYRHYRIQYTPTLSPPNWIDLTNFFYLPPVTIADPGAVNGQSRWYQAVSP